MQIQNTHKSKIFRKRVANWVYFFVSRSSFYNLHYQSPPAQVIATALKQITCMALLREFFKGLH